MENDPKQLSLFDLDNNLIDNPGEEKKHPLNNETTLEGFKDRVKNYIEYKIEHKDNKFYFYIFKNDLLLESPFLSNNIDYIPNKEDFIKLYNGYRIEKEELDKLREKYNKSYIYLVDNDSSQLTEENKSDILANNKEYQGYRYLIAYYFNNPYEKKEDKINYILSLNKFEYPKKYVYDIINKKEILRDGTLTAIDKNFLNLGFNEFESWDYSYKPLLERYYNKQGLEAIKKYYDSIPHDIEPNYLRNHIDHAIEYKEYNFFMDILLNEIIQEKALTNKNIVDYKTILKARIERINNNIIYIDNEIKQRQDLFNSILESNKLDSGAFNKWLLSNNPNMELKEIRARDSQRYSYFKKTNRNELLYPDELKDYNYIDSLKLSDKDSLEYAYFIYLEYKDLDFKNLINKASLRKNKESLKKIDQDGTIEAYYQDQAKIYFNSKYHLRDNRELIEQEEILKGNIASYSNNIVNIFKYDSFSFKNLNEPEEKDAQELINRINELESKIKDNEEKIKNSFKYPDIDINLLREENEEDKKLLEHLKKMKAQKGYISFNDGLKIISHTQGSNKDIMANIEETKDHIIIKYNDNISIQQHKSILVDTKKNNKKITQEKSISELTSKKSTRLNLLSSIIIDKASNTRNNKIELDKLETLEALGLNISKTTLKDSITELRLLLTILQDRKLTASRLKTKSPETKARGKVEYKKTTLETASISFISDFIINDDKILITLGNILEETIKNNTSKIWKKETIKYNNPNERLILDKSLSLLAQPSYSNFNNKGEYLNNRNIAIATLISPIHEISSKMETIESNNFKRDIGTPTFNLLNSLNKNPNSPIDFDSKELDKIKYYTTPEELENTISIKYKKDSIPSKIKHEEESRKDSIAKIEEKKSTQKKKKS